MTDACEVRESIDRPSPRRRMRGVLLLMLGFAWECAASPSQSERELGTEVILDSSVYIPSTSLFPFGKTDGRTQAFYFMRDSNEVGRPWKSKDGWVVIGISVATGVGADVEIAARDDAHDGQIVGKFLFESSRGFSDSIFAFKNESTIRKGASNCEPVVAIHAYQVKDRKIEAVGIWKASETRSCESRASVRRYWWCPLGQPFDKKGARRSAQYDIVTTIPVDLNESPLPIASLEPIAIGPHAIQDVADDAPWIYLEARIVRKR